MGNPRLDKYMQERKEKLEITMVPIYAWLIVTAVFIIVSLAMGGTAVNGKIENGHFYLGEHGVYKEVSKTTYITSALWLPIWVLLGAGSFAPIVFKKGYYLLFKLIYVAIAIFYIWTALEASHRCLAEVFK